MSVDTIRQAANRMRESWETEDAEPAEAEFYLSVADWLDTAGADLWAHGPLCECFSGCHDCDDDVWQPHVRRALAVARAYLGESA